MTLSDVFLSFGESDFAGLLRHISMSRLKTYQLFETLKVRTHLVKLNNEHLRKAAPRLWARLAGGDADLATDLSQAILVSHIDMIIAALDLLGIPHQEGFFGKDANVGERLTGEWQQKVYDALKDKHDPLVLRFYINHLGVETGNVETLFAPGSSVQPN